MSCSPWSSHKDQYLVCRGCGAPIVRGEDDDPDALERTYECGSVWTIAETVYGSPRRIHRTYICGVGARLQRLIPRVAELEKRNAG